MSCDWKIHHTSSDSLWARCNKIYNTQNNNPLYNHAKEFIVASSYLCILKREVGPSIYLRRDCRRLQINILIWLRVVQWTFSFIFFAKYLDAVFCSSRSNWLNLNILGFRNNLPIPIMFYAFYFIVSKVYDHFPTTFMPDKVQVLTDAADILSAFYAVCATDGIFLNFLDLVHNYRRLKTLEKKIRSPFHFSNFQHRNL